MTFSKNYQNSYLRKLTVLLLCCFFIAFVVLPLASMLINLKNVDFSALLSDEKILSASINSLTVSFTATVIAIAVASLVAWCMNRTAVKFKSAFNILVMIPMLIPSISHAMGLIILARPKGIYGFWGIVAGSVMYAFPVAYIMISDILKYEDSTPYEAASVLGINKFRRFCSITLPYLRKPMISVIFAVFTLIVTDYGVPIMIGGTYTTLPKLMYEEVICGQNFSKGSFFSIIFLIPAVAAFFIDFLCKNNRKGAAVPHPFELQKNKVRDAFAYTSLFVISALAIIPIFIFSATVFTKNYPIDLSFTFDHILYTLRDGAATYLLNSVCIALLTSLIGCFLSFICACFTARSPGISEKILHLMSIVSLAIPGIVLGLSWAMFFNKSFIYGTLIILILVNSIHFFSSPYLMIYNSIGKLNPNLESTAASLGINKFHLIKDVILPQTKSTVIEMFSYFFVNCMMTISAVSFLYSIDTKPISLMIPRFEAQMLYEKAAFVSSLILFTNLLMKISVYIVKKIIQKNQKQTSLSERNF